MTKAHKTWMDKPTSMYFPKEGKIIPEAARVTKPGGTEISQYRELEMDKGHSFCTLSSVSVDMTMTGRMWRVRMM